MSFILLSFRFEMYLYQCVVLVRGFLVFLFFFFFLTVECGGNNEW